MRACPSKWSLPSLLTQFKFPFTGMAKNSGFLEQVTAIFRREDEIIIVRLPHIQNTPHFFVFVWVVISSLHSQNLTPGMPKWQEVSHGSSRTLLRRKHVNDNPCHRRCCFINCSPWFVSCNFIRVSLAWSTSPEGFLLGRRTSCRPISDVVDFSECVPNII